MKKEPVVIKHIILIGVIILIMLSGTVCLGETAWNAPSDDSPWSIFRFTVAVDGDGYNHYPEEMGEMYLCFHQNRSGFLYTGEAMQRLNWDDSNGYVEVDCEKHTVWLTPDDSGNLTYSVSRPGDPKNIRLASTIYLAPAPEMDQSAKYVGEWTIPGSAGDFYGMNTETKIVLEADGTARYASEVGDLAIAMFGESYTRLGEWIVLDGHLFLLDPKGNGVSVNDFRMEGDSIVLEEIDIPDDADFILDVPLNMESAERYASWSGLWYCEDMTDGVYSVYTLDAALNGTAMLLHADALNDADTTHSFEGFFWSPMENGITLSKGTSEPVTINYVDGTLRYPLSDGRYIALKLASGNYAALVESAEKTGRYVKEILGVWDVRGVQADGETFDLQVSLEPDSDATVRIVTREADVRNTRYVENTKSHWMFSDSGIIIYEGAPETASEAALFDLPLSDGIPAAGGIPMTRTAEASAWNGKSYGEPVLADYMSTGYVGVWKNTSSLDNFSDEYFIICLAADGTGELIYDERDVYPLKWKPITHGFSICPETDMRNFLTDAGIWVDISTDNYVGSMNWNTINHGIVSMRQISDFWASGDTAPAEITIDCTDNGDGTVTLTDYFGASGNIELPAQIDGKAVTAIGDELFDGDISITGVVIPDGVERIGSRTFRNCTALESVKLPGSLTHIGESAFDGCTALKDIELPGSLQSIGARAFYMCKSIPALELDGNALEIGNSAFDSCEGIQTLTFGPGVVSIGARAFGSCYGLTDLTLPASITAMGESAFSGCTHLVTLKLSDGITVLSDSAFQYCYDLEEVIIPGSISIIPAEAFKDCDSLKRVEILSGVTQVGDSAFVMCENLDTVILPESLRTIDKAAFSNNPLLENVVIPQGVTNIGEFAFAYCPQIKNIILPESLASLGKMAFAGCTRLQSVYIPDSAGNIGDYVFDSTDVMLIGGKTAQAYAEKYGIAYQAATIDEATNNPGSFGAFLPGYDSAGTVDDSEQSLRYILFDITGRKDFEYFLYGDFDGDGTHEAFAMIATDSSSSDIWFVSNRLQECMQTGKSYYSFEACGESAPYVITAEEGYGGSGSTTHMWILSDGSPEVIDVDIYGGLSYGGNGEFHAYPSAFDGSTDGTGHTWKRYYYHLDGDEFREYGGIYITLNDLLKFEGAQAIIDGVQAEGYNVMDIIYRANGVINVNLRRGVSNNNLTLRYDESSVTDTEEHYGGVYQTASTPQIADYPDAFIEPVSTAPTLPPITFEPVEEAPAETGDSSAPAEELRMHIYKRPGTEELSDVILAAYDANGAPVAEIRLFDYYEAFSEYTDFNLKLYRLSDGWYYAESAFLFEGIQRFYILLTLDDGVFTIEQIVEDPGYSDGYGLRDPYTYADYYIASSESPNVVADMSDILNDMFAGHGLVFEWPNAVSVDGELLLDLSKDDLAFEAAPAAPAAVPGTVSRQDIQNTLGVFDFNALRHVSSVDNASEYGIETYNVWLNEDVYSGGSDGYYEDWLTSDGIFAETDVDLDGDGTDEYVVLYHKAIPVDYDYQDHEFRLAVYEPENGNYRLAADVPVCYDMMGIASERFARIVSNGSSLRILTGYIAFWDGGGGGVTGYMYGYDGSEIYCDLLIGATTDSRTFVVDHRIPADKAYDIRNMCEFYEEYESELGSFGIVHGENLHTVDFNLWNKADPYTYLEPDRFEGIELAGQFTVDYGVVIRAEIRSTSYRLYCDGGDTLAESSEEWSSGSAYVRLQHLTTLNHFASGSRTSTPADDSDDTSGTVAVTGTVRITGSVNLRSGPGINYGKVSSAKKGKTLPYLGETVYDDRSPAVAWYKVERNNGEAAWVSEKYAVLENVREVAATAAPAATPAPVATATPAPTKETVSYGSVKTTGSVNLRSGPGLGYDTVSSAKKGKTFTYLGEMQYDNRTPPVAWYKVQLKNGGTAWISSKYAKLTNPVDNGSDTGSTFKTLSKGSKGDRVVDLQDMLAYLGYHTGTVDGDYGNQTVKSVTAFQNAYGLDPTGKVDEKTWNAICEAAGR